MPNPKPAKPQKQATPAAESSAAVWFKLYPAKWAAMAMREPDNSKLGERVRRIVLALCEQEPGADAFADEVMQSTAEAMKAAREKAQKAAFARWEKERREREKKGCPSNAQASDGGSDSCSSNAKRKDLRDGELRDGELEELPRPRPKGPPESVSVRESVCMSLGIQDSPELRQETIENLAPDELPVGASNFCQESDPVQAAFAYRKQLHRIGAETFREELSAFVAELDAGGEEPDSRGAAFMSRLKDIEAKQPGVGHE
jgi:hypothetical protein